MGRRQIVLDTETTGLKPEDGNRIIEIGCVELIDKVETGVTYQVYLNPDRDKFGSLTLEDYVKAKHKINYNDLPDSGLGLTKSEAVKE